MKDYTKNILKSMMKKGYSERESIDKIIEMRGRDREEWSVYAILDELELEHELAYSLMHDNLFDLEAHRNYSKGGKDEY